MSRTRRFLGGLTYGYLNQALLMLVGLWLTPFLLRMLGQHDYGLWLVAAQILSYLMLTDLGVVALLPRETAYELGRAGEAGPGEELTRTIGQVMRLVLWQMPVVAAAAGGIWLGLPAKWVALSRPLAWLLAAFVVIFPLRIFHAVLQGLQDLAFLGRVQVVSWVISTGVTVLLVVQGAGLYALAAGWFLQQALSVSAQWLRLRRLRPGAIPLSLPKLDRERTRRYLASGVWMSGGQVAQALLGSSDVLLIGALLGPTAVVPYACTAKLISVLANQPQMVMQVAIPALSELRYAESAGRLHQVSAALTQAMLVASGAIFVVVLSVNRGFIGWWVGPEQYGGLALTVVLAVVMLLRHWNTTAVFTTFCFGYERRISLLTLADGLLTVGGGALLLRFAGPIGVPLGSLAGVCLVSLPGNLSALLRETQRSLGALLAPLVPWAWRFAVLAAASFALARAWSPADPLALAGIGGAWGLLYLAVMLPVVLGDPLGLYVRPRLAAARAWLFGPRGADGAA